MDHNTYLQRALACAKEGMGTCAPNPAVGAVLVNDNCVVAEGYHRKAGEAHAEAKVLQPLSLNQTKNATLYVTLSPCGHWGKTPPCTKLIIQKQIARVIYAYRDPHSHHCNDPITQLKSAGIIVKHQQITDIDAFYQPYTLFVKYNKPWVVAKLAVTQDSRTALSSKLPYKITDQVTDNFTHQQRYQSHGILTTLNTINYDDPSLNARLSHASFKKPLFVLDRKLQLSTTAKIFNTTEKIYVFYHQADQQRLNTLKSRGVRCISVSLDEFGGLNIGECLDHIAQLGYYRLWIEAGGTFFERLVNQHYINEYYLYVGNTALGARGYYPFTGTFDVFSLTKTAIYKKSGNVHIYHGVTAQ